MSMKRLSTAPDGRLADAATRSVLDDLRRIVRTLRESSRGAEIRLGVSGAQLFVLRTLAQVPSGATLSLNELAARTHTHQSSVSVVVKRLVAGKLVSSSSSVLDARRLELSLTARGRNLLERAPLAAQDVLIEGLGKLRTNDRVALAGQLRQLVNAMGLRGAAPEMFFEDSAPAAQPLVMQPVAAARAKPRAVARLARKPQRTRKSRNS